VGFADRAVEGAFRRNRRSPMRSMSPSNILIALGIMGMATMWEAVFADVGVALLAIFNAIRIMKG